MKGTKYGDLYRFGGFCFGGGFGTLRGGGGEGILMCSSFNVSLIVKCTTPDKRSLSFNEYSVPTVRENRFCKLRQLTIGGTTYYDDSSTDIKSIEIQLDIRNISLKQF